MKLGNLYRNIPPFLPAEVTDTLVKADTRCLRIERIVSQGQVSPPDFWYEQETAEWVVLLQGGAVLRFAQDNREVAMQPGDFVHIAAGERHRVDATAPDIQTVWLAVFY